ncbi:dipeptidyl aminopeptidase/acylaminoacyl peptidase [Granulicella aggregans]|uniref:Dipeptidyl aminopeptidase/acylaminoacyl peptidase n=1 Tax=Granulicella aggregans TaxID=474949 RepID=A0A7W8E248_9BACT|nr:prolyl oligopeptidase family serine peptidase [Granulicella aggregans]MBB5056117.1 dipeptidyl aminopeptidase/acylaminoacyl peptidase [Granulicella aggregans]
MSARRSYPHSAVFALALVIAATAFAQSGNPAPMQSLKTHDPRLEKITEAMHASKSPTYVALSPDGATVAWTLNRSEGTQLHITPVADPAKDTVLKIEGREDCASEAPVWSPDGTALALTSSCTPKSEKAGQEQIFLWTKSTSKFKQLTHLTGNVQSLAFSPDGKSIAFLFVENATRSAGALAAMKPWSGVIGEDGIEIQRVAAVDVASSHFSFLSPKDSANLHVYEFDWSPDSRFIAFIAANPPGENNWWVAKLYVAGVVQDGNGRIPDGEHVMDTMEFGAKVILDPATIPGPLHGLQIAVPRFSPDGSQIAFIGGIMSDQGSTGGDIYLVSSKGGEPKDITPNREATPAWFSWVNSDTLGVSEMAKGNTHLFAYDIASQKDIAQYDLNRPETLRAGGLSMRVSLSADSQSIAYIRSSFDMPPEIYAGPFGSVKQITHLNDGIKPVWGKSESIEWKNDDFNVQGWLLYPADYNPAKKYPLLVEVHGGPSAALGNSWAGGGALFSAMGYFVFSPNPRGSYGQGERFTQANVKDFGYGDLRDVLKGMDVLEAKYSIDKNREGLTGWSYGGFMTMFGVTQTNRFKAAVAGAGISDWKSYYGQNSIDQWMTPFFGATVYDDPAVYAKSSAIEYIKNVKTPTLILVGDRDGECPAPQSFEFWHALRAEGVKTQLVVYPNEGHHFVDPAHTRDRDERMLNWFATEMPEKQ